MACLTKNMSFEAIKNMQKFHYDLEEIFTKNGMDFKENLGRRNIVMSHAQEKFFTEALRKKFKRVINDGRTGQPDIVIEDEILGTTKEIECKLTTRHRSGAISFQSDYETLVKKKQLDYLYVIASDDFDKFAVLYFEGLTVDDFRPLSNGARGKVAMYKHKGFKKCKVLLGNVSSMNEINIKKLKSKISDNNVPNYIKNRAKKSLKYWMDTPEKFKIELETTPDFA